MLIHPTRLFMDIFHVGFNGQKNPDLLHSFKSLLGQIGIDEHKRIIQDFEKKILELTNENQHLKKENTMFHEKFAMIDDLNQQIEKSKNAKEEANSKASNFFHDEALPQSLCFKDSFHNISLQDARNFYSTHNISQSFLRQKYIHNKHLIQQQKNAIEEMMKKKDRDGKHFDRSFLN